MAIAVMQKWWGALEEAGVLLPENLESMVVRFPLEGVVTVEYTCYASEELVKAIGHMGEEIARESGHANSET